MPLSLRTRLGVRAGALAGGLSRALGRGAGATLPGRVTLAVAPRALADLAAGRDSVMITGTNGKTTTTAFLVAALGDEHVVTNATGANLPTGIVAALAGSTAPRAVLETDELHVPAVMRSVIPRALVLLNLSRDQLDRTHEVRRAVDLWRGAIAASGSELRVVANAADPNVAYAAMAGAQDGDGAERHRRPEVVWVDGGLRWFGDAELCPRCDGLLEMDGGAADPGDRSTDTVMEVGSVTDSGRTWHCPSCALAQPPADYALAPDGLRVPGGAVVPLAPRLPGAANLSNAAFAVATAAGLGIEPSVSAARLSEVSDVAGRYATIPLGTTRRPTRMLLAKNPAGWTVALDLLEPAAVLALGVNARTQDGTDTSWLWDVPFEHLAGRTVGVFGDRAADLELRLVHAGVTAVRAPGSGNFADAHALADQLPAGDLTLLATYTAFQEVRRGG